VRGARSLQVLQLLRREGALELVPAVLVRAFEVLHGAHDRLLNSLRRGVANEGGHQRRHVVRQVVWEEQDHTCRHSHGGHVDGVWLVALIRAAAVFGRLAFLALSVRPHARIVNN
jgi:hypothetical protein